MLHIHIPFVAPLCPSHVPQPSADQHQGRIPIREGPNYPCAAADLPIEPLDGVVGADAGPVFGRKVTIKIWLTAPVAIWSAFVSLKFGFTDRVEASAKRTAGFSVSEIRTQK